MPHQRNLARWLAVWATLNLAPPTGLCEQLLRAWDEPQRHYHTQQHLTECLTLFDTLCAHAEQPADIELAVWFHDAIYDVHGHDNEARSAHWAVQALATGGVDAARCQRVHDLIMVTCHTALPASPDQALLVDIDLAILGAPAARFAEYTRQIDAEYAWVPPEMYAVKRRSVLQGFLDREQIYTTPAVAQRLEQRARNNLAEAISSL
ncbi:N-methyl-D-aspartate receptor NMDAR2C subunit [Oxalobacteraceae sp. CFBP 13730]|nr:N-methyl-D-aspartate receptor NMDAR2C subunit [Oxalobacteraceae sp. CFBP 13730]